MGYESRIIIAENMQHDKRGEGYHIGVAEIDLCVMGGDGWFELFKDEFKGQLYLSHPAGVIEKDGYDKPLTYTTIDKLYYWCQSHHNDSKGFVYWRQSVLESMLKELMLSNVAQNLIAIHYGF